MKLACAAVAAPSSAAVLMILQMTLLFMAYLASFSRDDWTCLTRCTARATRTFVISISTLSGLT
jgi:hypothetical protein